MRQKHLKVWEAFRAFKYHSEKSCSTNGRSIFSYSTEILRQKPDATDEEGIVWQLNKEKFSQTTTELQNSLRLLLTRAGLQWEELVFW